MNQSISCNMLAAVTRKIALPVAPGNSFARCGRNIVALALFGAVACAQAALPVGAVAPDFTAQAALAGKEFTFNLKQALGHGPVVLYFYPKSFTSGCTAEAHDFAEASALFEKLGATLLGM